VQQDFVNNMNDFSKQALNAAQALGAINSQLAEQLLAQQMELASLCVEGSVKQLRASQDSKDIKDYLEQQTQLVQEYTDKFTALAKNHVNLAQALGEKYQAWFTQGVAQANDAAETAAKSVKAAVKAKA
jgi:hypothetical protein